MSDLNMNVFHVGDAVRVLHSFDEEVIDMTVTSPPYEDLREYNGYQFDAMKMLVAIHRVTKEGGICVWVVGEKIRGSRSLSSFNHAFIGKEAGFDVHDVMIYQKKSTPFMRSNAYTNCYELMIVFSKGIRSGWETAVHNKGPDAVNMKRPVELKKEKVKTNIWQYAVGMGGTTTDKVAFRHPAIFPESLARDHLEPAGGHCT